jgi:NDP-sugar pyrophosphorylase family protein
MNAIILCGGLSTRLGDITKSIPKILLDIKGKTVLDWQLEKLKAAGITDVVMAAGHLAQVLQTEVGPERQGIKLKYAIEPEKLGTGGAIKYAWQQAADPDAPTIVLNGDILTTVDIADMQRALRQDSEGVILGSKVDNAASYGTLVYDEAKHLLEFKEKEGLEKPGYINGGFYLFTPHAKKHFPDQSAFSIEYDVFPNMKNLDVFESEHPWIDIGVPERLAWAREKWGTTHN